MRRGLKRKMIETFGRDTIGSPHAQDMLLRSEISLVAGTAILNGAVFLLALGAHQLF